VPTILPNFGGSLPNDVFSEGLGLPTIWVPPSYPGCSQHAPDEHILLSVTEEALGIMAGLYWDLGDLGKPNQRGIYVGSLDGTPATSILPAISNASYVQVGDAPGQDGYLLFQTGNRVPAKQAQDISHGFGIQNLRKRLTLLYGTKFELNIYNSNECFTAFLKVPLS